MGHLALCGKKSVVIHVVVKLGLVWVELYMHLRWLDDLIGFSVGVHDRV